MEESGEPSQNQIPNAERISEKYEGFKRFDSAEDYSDHYYRNGKSCQQTSKKWLKKILQEWKILENNIPETIYVRVYESRMDLMRAVIIGAQGTPYHDGLFFFDIYFPGDYPAAPPLVYHHSHGVYGLNPNLYHNGKVCISIINTWVGIEEERWNPHQSTILQLLVSIQGLVLNSEPYFNEPGHGLLQWGFQWLNSWIQPLGSSFLHSVINCFTGFAALKRHSTNYNERAFLASLAIMVYTVRKPPKGFEDFVMGHFVKNSNRILSACDAYMMGAQIGSQLIQGSAAPPFPHGRKMCSNNEFLNALVQHMKSASTEFARLGSRLADSPFS